MKNRIGIVLIFITSVLIADIFENNTDRVSHYMFDTRKSFSEEKMHKLLKIFQDGEATENEIKAYLIIRDDNVTFKLDEDVSVLYGDNTNQKTLDKHNEEENGLFSWFYSSKEKNTTIEENQ